jgi:uncharacterized protein YdcH (DUF465 family)
MSFEYFKSLLHRSTLIQKEIDEEQKRRWPDKFRLIKLKKIRLFIKDRLHVIIFNGLRGKKSKNQDFLRNRTKISNHNAQTT